VWQITETVSELQKMFADTFLRDLPQLYDITFFRDQVLAEKGARLATVENKL
jgi:hypothetical protein